MRRAALLVLVALALIAAGCGGSGSDTESAATTDQGVSSKEVPAGAVALVGDTPIPKTSYDALVVQAKKGYEGQGREFPQPGTAEYEALKNQAVQYLVQRAQFEQEAKALGITVTDADVEKRIDELKQQYFEGDDMKFEEQLKQQGLTAEQVKDDVRAQVVSEKIFESVTKDVTVPDADLQKYYDENKAQYQVAESRDVRHILVKSKKTADDIHQQLVDGADFAELAKKYSEDPGSKDNGGKYEAVQEGQFVPPFDKYLFSAKTNELSEPIKTSFGWHVIEPLSDIKPASTTPFADVKDSIQTQLGQQKKNEAMAKWVEAVQKKYDGKVAYAVGFAPPPTQASTEAGTDTVAGDTSASAK